ncbi:ABC transporter permease [Streptomyces sp. NPDC059455]|uniref:ABC transporter permease n=1 Tax=Streptomyces sp. NPDC059455 TaxID=3346837 RepID=UPI0036C342F3
MALGLPSNRDALKGRPLRLLSNVALELILPVSAVAAWWFFSSGSTSAYFPPLSDSVEALQRVWLFSHFASDAVPSLLHLATGMGIALVIGVAAGLVLGLVPFLANACSPLLEFARATPGVALVPAALLLFGIGADMQVSLIAYGTVWPILLNTVDGVLSVDPVVRDVATSYRLRRSDRVLRVVLPAASPQIIAGARTALSIGITVIVFSEMAGSTNGIGFRILQAQRSFAIADMWAGMLFLGIIGYLVNIAFRGLENYLLRWHRGTQRMEQQWVLHAPPGRGPSVRPGGTHRMRRQLAWQARPGTTHKRPLRMRTSRTTRWYCEYRDSPSRTPGNRSSAASTPKSAAASSSASSDRQAPARQLSCAASAG